MSEDQQVEFNRAYRKEQTRLHEAHTFWANNCPESYKLTEYAKLPDQRAARAVADWKYGPKGLLLVGPSRAGKTRSAWLAIQEVGKIGKRCMAFDGLSWFIGVSRAFGNLETADDFFNAVCSVDLLFLDDIFRGKMTEAQDVGLWGVIERRMAAGLPCIVTTNATGQTLIDRCGAQVIPIIERIRECCEVVSFSDLTHKRGG